MEKIKIALMAGGNSSEREVSLGSAAQVAASLDRLKYDVYIIDVKGRDWTYTAADGSRVRLDRNDFSLMLDGRRTVLDYALIMIHGTPGEDGRMQGYLDMMGIPYSSCGMVSSVVTFDKITTKRAVAGCGINMAREICIRRGEAFSADGIVGQLGLPLFVKPNASGSSCGVTKVTCAAGLPAAIEAAFAESDAVLVEEFIEGREIGCGIMMTADSEYVLPVTEIVSKKDFFDYEAKYTAGMSEEITPAALDDVTLARVNDMTRRIYRACGCRGVVRIDFIIRASDGEPFMIEVNSIPGMSAGSIVPKQLAAAGMTVGQLYDLIITDTYGQKQ